jgi:hypothetical protein
LRSNREANFPKRISIVGATGSGKSYLARNLAAKLGLPLYQLDQLRWDASGREIPQEQFIGLVRRLAAKDEWIIDGHYRVVRDIVWKRAQLVTWLNYPLPLIAFRLLRRFLGKGHGHKASNEITGIRKLVREGTASPAQVSWKDRLGRLVRTMHERGEYRKLLQAPAFAKVEVIELVSPSATSKWLGQFDAPIAAE